MVGLLRDTGEHIHTAKVEDLHYKKQSSLRSTEQRDDCFVCYAKTNSSQTVSMKLLCTLLKTTIPNESSTTMNKKL